MDKEEWEETIHMFNQYRLLTNKLIGKYITDECINEFMEENYIEWLDGAYMDYSYDVFNTLCADDLVDLINKYFELKEKATPKKGLMKYDVFGDGVLRCPNCMKPITNVWSKRDYNPNFCHHCGQSLCWSESEEEQ